MSWYSIPMGIPMVIKNALIEEDVLVSELGDYLVSEAGDFLVREDIT